MWHIRISPLNHYESLIMWLTGCFHEECLVMAWRTRK